MSVDRKKPQWIAILSGKGGAGKTCVAVSLAKYLTLLGKDVLLVDGDLSGHGASLFVRMTTPLPGGLVEASRHDEEIGLPPEDELDPPGLFVMGTADGFVFLPSRTEFGRMIEVDDVVVERAVHLVEHVVARTVPYDYVIVDCQAGYNPFARLALRHCQRAVIVMEADAISTAAVRNVETQYSAALPEKTFLLINKLHLREMSSYRQVYEVLSSLGHLPPIPFDFDVRSEFGSGRVPLDPERPTAYFFAISRVAYELFPGLRDEVSELTEGAKEGRKAEARRLLADLLDRREETIRKSGLRRSPMVDLMWLTSTGLGAAALTYAVLMLATGREDRLTVGVMAGAAGLAVVLVLGLQFLRPTHFWQVSGGTEKLDEEIRELQTLIASGRIEELAETIAKREKARAGEPRSERGPDGQKDR